MFITVPWATTKKTIQYYTYNIKKKMQNVIQIKY